MMSRTLHFLLSFAAAGLILGTGIIASEVLAADMKSGKAPAATETSPANGRPALHPHIGSSTGLPIPRFVALRADAVNLRVGPGDQYPILWVYHRVGLPVEVLREFDVWRLVVDSEGVKGWMHEATLTDRRHFVITGKTPQTLYRRPHAGARPRARLMPGVVGALERCAAGSDWCHVRVDHLAGWLQRSEFWGTLPGEKIPGK